ncbi:MAG: DUF4176 domain-containing protein [Eubacteriales bacterium]|nr:DUF4176 domain-containing protein [Eubacteriales bacterium]
MDIKELLPVGSVVLLKNGEKKLMVVGVKQTDTESNTEYDYLSVLYPEGYINPETMFFFNHDAIDEVFFRGMEDEERSDFIERLDNYYSSQNVIE